MMEVESEEAEGIPMEFPAGALNPGGPIPLDPGKTPSPSRRSTVVASATDSDSLGAVRFATGIFMLLEVIPSARLCGSELLGGHGVGPDIADRPRR